MHPDTPCKDKLKVLLKQAAAGDFAPGLPDPARFGDVKDIPKDRLLPYVVQLHKARRAGTHYDVRFGPDQLYSWATKKELPGPGKKTLLFQQPLHCFPPNMRVETEQGAIEIGKIVEEKMAIRVLSTDDDGKTTYERVTNYWKRDNRDDLLHFMVAVPFTRTAHIVCTKEHRLFSHGEKIEAGNLVKGDMLDRILPCPNPDQEQILLGSFLGDSNVGPNCVFRFFHALSGEEYFWWKAGMLKAFFRTRIEFKSKGSYSKTPLFVASGPSNHPWFSCFDKYRGEGLIDREYLERLGPLALAVWYQDDGSISKSGSKFNGCSIATHSYPVSTISDMRDWFRDRFGLKSFAVARGNKDCWELRFNSSESMKFFEIISPYIHPSMSYKIELPDSWHRRKCKVCGCDVSCNVQLCDTCFTASLSPYSNSGDFRKAYYRKETLISPKTINNRCGTWEKAKSGEFVVSSEPITIPSFVCGSLLPDLSSKEEFKVCPVRIFDVRKVESASRKYPVVYDLEVENTHRYVIQGGFVVSNSGSYADFEGELTSGYGAGTVKTYDKGKVIVTKAEPDHINFTVTHRKFPENYSLVRVGGAPESSFKTARGRASQGGTWLMVNTTPRDAAKMLGGKPEEVGLSKLRYVRVPAEEVEKVFDPAYLVQEKIDGASTLFHLLSDRIEALSYRTSKSGHPIVHTYRIFGPGGGKVYTKPIPPELVGTILKGETYGERIGGGVIPVQELGGILNASVLRSLEKQKEGRVRLKNMLFDVVRMGKEPVEPLSLTPEERLAKLREVSKVLPKRIFHLPETAETPEEARSLFERIRSGEHPRTAEGIVAWPREPGKVPRKVKLSPEADVWIKSIFPGMGKLEGAGAGGFEYSRSPEGPVVGRVGTGFTEQTRKEMLEDPESWVGRIARIHSQGDFPRTGAFRAPAFIGLHEDYPMKTAALKPDVVLQPHQERVIEKIKQEPAVLVYHGLGSGKTLASIAAGEQFPGKKEIIVPASLRENYAKELRKFVRGTPQGYNIKSYQKAVEEPPDPEAALTVFDEAHRMGRAGTQVSVLPSKAQGKTLLLSGTPLRNDPGEIAPLLRVLARDRDAPESGKMFNALFIGEREIPQGFWEKVFNVPPGTEQFLRNKQKLRDLLAGRVDYHPAAGEYPERINERVEVDMDPVQSKLYRGFLNSNPKIAYKIIRNLPPSKSESVVLNSFLNAVRQISNNPKPFDKTLTGHPFEYSAKMRRMFSELRKGMADDPNFKGLVYSNYLESGVVPLAEKLEEAGIPHGVYTGELDDKRKKALVDAYNAGTIKVLLVSGAGSEGLDLKGTKLIQIMEPHWNDARVEQVIGRGIRHRSHVHLPPGERKVRVQMYYSKPLPTFLDRIGLSPVLKYIGGPESETGADIYMTNLAEKKQKLVDEMFEILKEVGSQPAIKRAEFQNRRKGIKVLLKRAAAGMSTEPYTFEDLTESELKAHKNILRKKIKEVGFSQAVGNLVALPFQLKDILMQPLEMWQYKRLAERDIDPEVLPRMMDRATYDLTPKWLLKQIGKHPGWVGFPALLGYTWARMGSTALGTSAAGTLGRSMAEGKSLPWDIAKGMGVGGLASLAASSPWVGADIYKDYKILQGHRPNAWFDIAGSASRGWEPHIRPPQKLTGPSHSLLRKLLIKNTALKAAIYALPGIIAGGVGAGMGYTGKRGVKQEKNIRPLPPDVDPNQIRSSFLKNLFHGPEAMYIERMKQSVDRIGKRLKQVRKAQEAEQATIAARVRAEEAFQSKFTGAVVDDKEKMRNMLLAVKAESEERLKEIGDTSGL